MNDQIDSPPVRIRRKNSAHKNLKVFIFFFFFKIASVEAFRAANCSAHGWFGDMALRSSPCWREERERESISGITLYLNVKRSDPHPLHRCNMWTVNDESEVVKRGFDSVFTLCIHKRPFCVIPCCWKKTLAIKNNNYWLCFGEKTPRQRSLRLELKQQNLVKSSAVIGSDGGLHPAIQHFSERSSQEQLLIRWLCFLKNLV